MNIVALLVKVAGLFATITVGANALSYTRFRRRNLGKIRSPIDESKEVLADFNSHEHKEGKFFFGLATAPAHSEDELDDAWLQFAKETPSSPSDAVPGSEAANRKKIKLAVGAITKGLAKNKHIKEVKAASADDDKPPTNNVAAWHNAPHAEDRLKFWSDPDKEVKLAKETGVTVFRMGIDWSRIMPKEPTEGIKKAVDYEALEHYKWILNRVRSNGMKVMLTLFHHSLPPWAADYGGWKIEKTVDYFMDFTRLVVDSMFELVDSWVTFNEPHVFTLLTYMCGSWPGNNPDFMEMATSTLPMGVFHRVLHYMGVAHSKAYDYIHSKICLKKPLVGIAHHVSFIRPYGLFDTGAVTISNSLTVYPYIDSISKKLDFIGINYYGQESVCGVGIKLVETDEYSESGRGIYPDGLYRVLLMLHERYKHLKIPFIVTENGVSDETDVIRRPYLIEHLLALYAAMLKGVPVLGYIFWTVSDNWEWADGYGPKFGLVAVDRSNNLARTLRPSYHLFSKIVKSGKITRKDRSLAWNELQRAAKAGKLRPFYRAVDNHGLMYADGLDKPQWRPYVDRDWRFGHYQVEGLQDPLSRVARMLLIWPLIMNKRIRKVKVKHTDETGAAYASPFN
ncbi:PREDICTED: beta-glucosidase-like SFR2, chloroplastic [Brassica oleracea var. oleracea]|uniref:beta-glucosidase-like SFR2, chloroplastic n=1 Tax=Brassica oleracea var. oleracea TaxID=109376 RepID=UPI0006A6FEBF|nr:PREDICTED: beta-glucosidase-like SFR2, chloroplastic [Brassica oleracea var. oleracea]